MNKEILKSLSERLQDYNSDIWSLVIANYSDVGGKHRVSKLYLILFRTIILYSEFMVQMQISIAFENNDSCNEILEQYY